MAKKIIKTGVEGRTELAKGAKALASAVGSTMGPYGQNWFLEKNERPTNDGISIAREFQLQDEVQNKGVKAMREAAEKVVMEVGDGTSSVIVFGEAIYEKMSKSLGKEGVMGKKPAELKVQLMKEKEEVIEKLRITKTDITTIEQLIDSAIVAVEDAEMGKLIGEAQWLLGPNGYLLAEETAERTSSVEITKGIRIDNGFGTSQIVTNQEKQILEAEDCRIILTSFTIKTLQDWQVVMKICDTIWKQGKTDTNAPIGNLMPIVIIARAWTDETINYCLQNINKGARIYPLSAPYVNMQERFKDLQAVLGGRFIDSESSDLEDLQLSDVGFAKKVVARRFDAIITGVDDKKTNERIRTRVADLTLQLEGEQSDFAKKALNERIAQLSNGFGVVKVGSPSDMERKRLFDKVEDAVNAVRVAYQGGTVKGAGLAFKEIAEGLPDDYLIKRPLMVIYEQIMFNAPSDFVIEDWIRDPYEVLRCVLERGCESASALATAGGAIVSKLPSSLDEMFGRQLNQNNNEQ